MTRKTILVGGIIWWYPLAGVLYQFLHYLYGLRSLGWDVYYFEDSARKVYDLNVHDYTYDWASTGHIDRLGRVLDAHGFAGKWFARCQYDNQTWGLTAAEINEVYQRADVFLNVTGGQELLPEHDRIPHKIYLETDPVKTEILIAKGHPEMMAVLDAHTCHFTFGENLGAADCGVPVVRYHWQPTRQPVALELWPMADGPGTAYTTIATWDNRGNDIEWNGEFYRWSKRPEFLKVIELPQLRKIPFEIATGIPPDDRTIFESHSWRLIDSLNVSVDGQTYNNYIRNSRGEFTVAKDQNIRLRSGWFSDRSCCYLAAGRPVITQDTAFDCVLPTGRGLFGFHTIADVLAALDAIETDYELHRKAAREIAGDCFSAKGVLASLLQRAGAE